MIQIIKRNAILQNPYVFFLPFLICYMILIYFKQADYLVSDAGRYWDYAARLLQGTYASTINQEYSFLWNGPGYSITLTPFVYFDAPYFIPRLMNAFYIYIGLVFFCKTLRYFMTYMKSIAVTLILACYYPFLRMALPVLFTECFCFLLICLFIYNVISYEIKKKRSHLVLSAFFLGFLALTKVIFGYVILTLVLLYTIRYIVTKKKRKELTPFVKLLCIAFLFCTPYLVYTYTITGKLLYWSNGGGQNLYWISTPYEGEQGEWHYFRTLEERQPEIYRNHKDFLESIENLDPVEKDTALKEKAVDNIMTHKKKFVQNWVSNISRTFFGFPNSKTFESYHTLRNIVMHGVLILGIAIALLLTFINRKSYDSYVIFIALVVGIYLGGISVLASLIRFLYPVVPFLIFWIAYTFEKFIKIERRKGDSRYWSFTFMLGDGK